MTLDSPNTPTSGRGFEDVKLPSASARRSASMAASRRIHFLPGHVEQVQLLGRDEREEIELDFRLGAAGADRDVVPFLGQVENDHVAAGTGCRASGSRGFRGPEFRRAIVGGLLRSCCISDCIRAMPAEPVMKMLTCRSPW